MSHKKLRPFIVKVSVLGYFPLHIFNNNTLLKDTLVSRLLCRTFRLPVDFTLKEL